MEDDVYEYLRHPASREHLKARASPPDPRRVSPQPEPTFPSSSSSSSPFSDQFDSSSIGHRHSSSWQSSSEHLPPAVGTSTSSSPSLPYSLPSSPAPSSVSRASSTSRRPLPSPPANCPRFVPFRPPPPPPPSLHPQTSSAYEEKRELARLRGLDDLLEHEGESDEGDSASPTLSDLPAYEGRAHRTTESGGISNAEKGVLDHSDSDEAGNARQEEKRIEQVEEVRRRVAEESRRIIEEDSRSEKGAALAQRQREEEDMRRVEAARLEVEMGKRREATERERERNYGPPPPLSINSREILPLQDTKDIQRSSTARSKLRQDSARPTENWSLRRHPPFPDPSPVTDYSTPIPPHMSSQFSIAQGSRYEEHRAAVQTPHVEKSWSSLTRAQHSLSSSQDLSWSSRPLPFSSEHNTSKLSAYDGSFPAARPLESSAQSRSKERQASIGPASSFYSAGVGLTIDQLRLDENRRNVEVSGVTSFVSPHFRSPTALNHVKLGDRPGLERSRSPPRAFVASPISLATPSPPPDHPSPPQGVPVRQSSPYTASISPQPYRAAQSPYAALMTSHGSQPAFYHSIGGQLLPFYPASMPASGSPQTFISPAGANPQLSLPPPPPPHIGYQSFSPPPQLHPFPSASPPIQHDYGVSPVVPGQARQRANRMSTIKSLFGRKGATAGGRDRETCTGSEWGVQEE